MIRELRQFNRR